MFEILQKITLLLLSLIVAFFLFLRIDIIHRGGPVMIAMIICSIFVMSIITERFWLFFRMRIDVSRFMEIILQSLKRRQVKEAIELCDKSPHPVGFILKSGIIKSGYSRDKIKEAMEDASLYEVPRLEKNLKLLATLAHLSPLLGLLGTATGLAKCFQVIQLKTTAITAVTLGDLSGGVWEALITTIAGLAIAIPAYLAYNYLVDRVDNFVLEMERSATELLNFLAERDEPGL
jgi:biopolymer transport protein ExbB